MGGLSQSLIPRDVFREEMKGSHIKNPPPENPDGGRVSPIPPDGRKGRKLVRYALAAAGSTISLTLKPSSSDLALAML